MTAQFQFTIPGDNAIIGGATPADDLNIVADRGMMRNVTPRVLTATFGDGYEQRVRDGVNPNNQKLTVSFRNRDSATIYKIAEWFDTHIGKAFTFTVTDHSGNTNIKVVCEEYNVSYVSEFFHSMDAVLRRVYEP